MTKGHSEKGGFIHGESRKEDCKIQDHDPDIRHSAPDPVGIGIF
jgi:hypothetical protein